VLYGADKRYEEAETQARLALFLYGELVPARRYLAGILAKKGDLAGAIAQYERLVSANTEPRDEPALALLQLMAPPYGERLSALERAGGDEQLKTFGHLLRGACHSNLGNSDLTVENWSRIRDLDEPGLQAILNLADGVGADRAAETLIPAIENAARSGADETVCYVILGEIRAELSENEAAVQGYKAALAANPDSALAHFRLGALYEQMEEYAAAATHLTASLAIDPLNANVCNHLGYMYAEQGTHLDEARELVERALEIEPKNGFFLDSLGWVYYKLGDIEKAIEFLLVAIANLGYDDAIVREHLGDAYWKAGAAEEAAAQWQRALRLDPNNTEISEKIKQHPTDDPTSS
jgi:tetratricopeptide (TPR) repeat protein